MEFWTVLSLLFLFGFSCTFSQSLTMNNVFAVTNCQTGLRANKDRLVFTATVNATGVQDTSWDSYVSFIVGSASSGSFIKDFCNVYIQPCEYQETAVCYCQMLYNEVYKVFFNLTATEDLNSLAVKMLWPRRDFQKGMDSNWINIPKIYKTNSEVNVLQVNLENITLSTSCKVQSKHSLSYMQYCCFNAPSPCVSTITYQGLTVTGNPCAVGNFIITPENMYKLSHSVCGQESSKTFSCVGESVTGSNVQVEEVDEVPLPSYNGYRNAAIFLASVIAIGLIIATVHRLDASLLFSSGSRRRMETMSIIRNDSMNSNNRPFNCC